MQRAALLRRTGTVTNAALRYDPGLAAHHAANSGALRSIRGTAAKLLNLLPLLRIAHQRDVAIDAVHELAVRHGDEQREHYA
jgi:hypothetical protein